MGRGPVSIQICQSIWIDTGAQPTPCKLVISYLTRPGQPQFSAVFTDWDFAPQIAESRFVADPAPGAQKIPFKLETTSSQQ